MISGWFEDDMLYDNDGDVWGVEANLETIEIGPREKVDEVLNGSKKHPLVAKRLLRAGVSPKQPI